jgi:DNA-binding response OmpR family regulator
MTALVLVVEPERALRDLLALRLLRLGCDVLLAEDGAEALELMRTRQPQLVLLDLFLPCLNGLAVLEQWRAQKPRPPVIVLSSFGFREIVRQTLATGVSDFLLKPIDLERLSEQVRRCLAPAAGEAA